MTAWTVIRVLLRWAGWFAALVTAFGVASDVWVNIGGFDSVVVAAALLFAIGYLAVGCTYLTLKDLCQ